MSLHKFLKLIFMCIYKATRSATDSLKSLEEIKPDFDAEYVEVEELSAEKTNEVLTSLKSHDESQETKQIQQDDEQYALEKRAGDMRDLFGSNVHFRQPNVYEDFGRRSMFNNHPYSKDFQKRRNRKDQNENSPIPLKAPPEIVLALAKEALKARAINEVDDKDDIIFKKILRTGDYWDSVWVEHVDPEKIAKTRKDDLGPKLGTVKTQVMPGTELYRLIAVLKQISPRLVYVINTPQKK